MLVEQTCTQGKHELCKIYSKIQIAMLQQTLRAIQFGMVMKIYDEVVMVMKNLQW